MAVNGNKTMRPTEHPELYVEALLMKRAQLPMQRKHIAVLMGVSVGRIWNVEQAALEKIRRVAQQSGVLS